MCSRKTFCAGAQGMARPRPPPLATKATGIPRTDCCLPSVQGADHGDRRLFLRSGTQKETGGRGTCQRPRKRLSRKRTPAPAVVSGSRSWHGAVCALCTVTEQTFRFSAPYQLLLIRGQPFFRAGCRPATAGRRVPAARRLAIVSCGTPFDVCTVPSAKFSGVTVRKSSTTRGHASQCPTRDLPKTAKRAIQKKNSGSRWQAEAGAGTARFAPFARLPNQHNVFGPVSVLADTGPALSLGPGVAPQQQGEEYQQQDD